jgi:AcrR family transcriptional regulator
MTAPSSVRAEASGGKSERILVAASRMFAEKGYSNVSVRDICRETGTTAPVLYYYFGSKKGLFDAVARKQISMGDLIAKLQSASKASDPDVALKGFVETYLTSFPERAFDPGLYLRDTASLDKTSAQMASDDLEKISKIATGIVRRLKARGRFRDADPEMASDCLLGMLNRVIFQHIHFSKRADREKYREFVLDFFYRAMKED